ncbi:MAG: SRPBCC family protein [Verrucomicrobiota bacterium]
MKFLLTSLVTLCALSSSFALEFTDFNEGQQEMLQNGQILVWSDDRGAKIFVCAAIVISHPIQTVWDLIDDKERAPEFLDGLEVARVVERAEDHVLIYQETRPATVGIAKRYKYTVKHMTFPLERVDFHRVSGDLRHIEGAWTFDEVSPSETMLLYELHIDPGKIVPQKLVARSQKEKLPQVMADVRDQLDSDQAAIESSAGEPEIATAPAAQPVP